MNTEKPVVFHKREAHYRNGKACTTFLTLIWLQPLVRMQMPKEILHVMNYP